MFIGTVQCEVELSKSHPAFEGLRFLLVEAEHEVEWTGSVVVVDCAGAELGDMVLVALAPLGERFDLPRDLPIAGAVVGVVGSITTPAEDGGDEEAGEVPAALERVEGRGQSNDRGRHDGPRHGGRGERASEPRGERDAEPRGDRHGRGERNERGDRAAEPRGDRQGRGDRNERAAEPRGDRRPGNPNEVRGEGELRFERAAEPRGERAAEPRGERAPQMERAPEPVQNREVHPERGDGRGEGGRSEGRFERGDRRDRRPRHEERGAPRPPRQDDVVGPPERPAAAPVAAQPVAAPSAGFTAVWDEPARASAPAPVSAPRAAAPETAAETGFDIVWDGGGAAQPTGSTLKRPRRRR